MRRISNIFTVILAVAFLVCTFGINADAAWDEQSQQFVIGGRTIQLDGGIYVVGSFVYANTEVTYIFGVGAAVLNFYADLIVEYDTAEIGYDSQGKTDVILSTTGSSDYVNAGVNAGSKTISCVACEHKVVDKFNLSDNGTIGTSIDLSSTKAIKAEIRTLFLPGIDF